MQKSQKFYIQLERSSEFIAQLFFIVLLNKAWDVVHGKRESVILLPTVSKKKRAKKKLIKLFLIIVNYSVFSLGSGGRKLNRFSSGPENKSSGVS